MSASGLYFESLKTLTRNETTSSLGNRIIGDERDEVAMANDTQGLHTRFVSQNTVSTTVDPVGKRMKPTPYVVQNIKNENSMSFSNFRINDSNHDLPLMNDHTQYKYELHKACYDGDLVTTKLIVNKPNSNINLNLKNKLGLTALDRAIEGKRNRIVNFLLNDVR